MIITLTIGLKINVLLVQGINYMVLLLFFSVFVDIIYSIDCELFIKNSGLKNFSFIV